MWVALVTIAAAAILVFTTTRSRPSAARVAPAAALATSNRFLPTVENKNTPRGPAPEGMTEALPSDVEAVFGNEFAKQLATIVGDGWAGPFTTAYGLHLVRITRRGEPTRATLADARDVVAREWSRAQRAKSKEQFYQALASRYTVRIEPDANVPRNARK